MASAVSQAILPIAGLGTRFLPWTKAVPKELLPIGSQPIVALIVDECLGVGIRDICFVLSRGKEVIPRYFEKDEKLSAELAKLGKIHLIDELKKYDEVRFHTVYQEKQLGDGHAILQAEGWIESKQLAVLFGDDLFVGEESGLRQLLHGFSITKDAGERAVIAVERIPRELSARYGIIDVADKATPDVRVLQVKGLVEKPEPEDAPSSFGVVGRYLIPRSTITALRKVRAGSKDGEVRLIDALIAQTDSINIFGYECTGKRLDTGTPEGYRGAVISFERVSNPVPSWRPWGGGRHHARYAGHLADIVNRTMQWLAGAFVFLIAPLAGGTIFGLEKVVLGAGLFVCSLLVISAVARTGSRFLRAIVSLTVAGGYALWLAVGVFERMTGNSFHFAYMTGSSRLPWIVLIRILGMSGIMVVLVSLVIFSITSAYWWYALPGREPSLQRIPVLFYAIVVPLLILDSLFFFGQMGSRQEAIPGSALFSAKNSSRAQSSVSGAGGMKRSFSSKLSATSSR